MNVAALVVSITAICFSLLSFLLTRNDARASEQRSRMPVLVFEFDGRRGWLLRNVGNGPALNVVVAEKHVRGAERGTWFNAVRVPPIGRDAGFTLGWLGYGGDTGLGALYDDSASPDEGGRSYTSTCGNDLTRTYVGSRFGPFPEDEIRAHWIVDAGPN